VVLAELHHRPQLDRHERLDVRPVLQDPAPFATGAGALEQPDVVGPHPGVEGHEVGAGEHVDGVDLEHAGALHGADERPHRRDGMGRVEEPLRGERDPSRLGVAERQRHGQNSTTTP
jgi:hypothetical protein